MNKNYPNLNIDIIFFFLSTLGSIATLFLVILRYKNTISKEKLNILEEKIHILFLITSSYFLIRNINNYSNLKTEYLKEKQERQILASIFVFLSSLINFLNDDHSIFI